MAIYAVLLWGKFISMVKWCLTLIALGEAQKARHSSEGWNPVRRIFQLLEWTGSRPAPGRRFFRTSRKAGQVAYAPTFTQQLINRVPFVSAPIFYTFELIRDHVECGYGGKQPAKDKGEMDSYFVWRERILADVLLKAR